MKNQIFQTFQTIAIVLIILFGLDYVMAWVGPTATPPNNNTPTPINVGTINQIKEAGLGVNALSVFGNSFFQGTLGIGDSTPDNDLKIDIEGKVGATEYCDQNGQNCKAITAIGNSNASYVCLEYGTYANNTLPRWRLRYENSVPAGFSLLSAGVAPSWHTNVCAPNGGSSGSGEKYQTECSAYGSNTAYYACCKFDVTNGTALDCKIQNSSGSGSWGAMTKPTWTATSGSFRFSCYGSSAGGDFLSCCRTNTVDGSTNCQVNGPGSGVVWRQYNTNPF